MHTKLKNFVRRCDYHLKKMFLFSYGWFYSGWGEYCYYGRRTKVLRNGEELYGTIVSDKRTGPTIILCDDGVIQRGGVYQPCRD